jgi:hypothetical protein
MSAQDTPPKPDAPSLTYDGGFEAIVNRMEARRDALGFGEGEALPPLEVDLAALKAQIITRPDRKDIPRARVMSGHMRKSLELIEEFEGEPALCHLHGLLIAHLRKREQPEHTMDLFTRIWREEHAFLIGHLDPRWLVSALATFGDHGQTETQRRVGQSLNVLLNMMKLYESERLYSGFRPEQEFKLKRLVGAKLAINMDRFAILTGGLDVNLLARLWVDAGEDEVLKPLAHRLLNLLNEDRGTVFRRLKTLKGRKERQVAAADLAAREKRAHLPGHAPRKTAYVEGQTWSIVSTIKAPPEQINTFIEHHARLGAEHLHIFLDAPVPGGSLDHWSTDLVTFTLCDEKYWQANARARKETHQQRQSFNATTTYRNIKTRWIAHIDVDEFLHPHRDLTDILAAQEEDTKALVMPPAEELCRENVNDPLLFRRTYFDAGVEKALLYDLYPTFGRYIKSGFISHTVGKTMARSGLRNARLGVHFVKQNNKEVTSAVRTQEINVLHRHASDWDSFARHLDYRMDKGSYRNRKPDNIGLGELIDILREEEGEDGPRILFDEICRARPDVVKVLSDNDMLIQTQLPRPEPKS